MNKTLDINVSKSYKVHLGSDNYEEVLKYITKGRNVFIITDENLEKLHLKDFTKVLEKGGVNYHSYVLEPGEKSKNLSNVQNIMDFLAENKMSRSDLIIAFGGGVVGDIAGFCAAIYLRGVDYIQIPTTLLSAVDSSVGGKTGVDLKAGKNLVGAFKQPLAVICNLNTFETLKPEEFNNGVYECIKYGVLFSRDYFNIFLEEEFSYNSKSLLHVVEQAILFKAKVVIEDEFDYGSRRLLNLGHTFGHAMEQASNYEIKHGFAVGEGIKIISKIAHETYGLSKEDLDLIVKVVDKYRNMDIPKIENEKMLPYVTLDKKIYEGVLNLIVPLEIGHCTIEEVKLSDVKELLEYGGKTEG